MRNAQIPPHSGDFVRFFEGCVVDVNGRFGWYAAWRNRGGIIAISLRATEQGNEGEGEPEGHRSCYSSHAPFSSLRRQLARRRLRPNGAGTFHLEFDHGSAPTCDN
jgi:hypothetical protein